MPSYGKVTVLGVLVDDLHLSVDKDHASLLRLLDLYVAFDYAILLSCMEAEAGIRGCVLTRVGLNHSLCTGFKGDYFQCINCLIGLHRAQFYPL